MDDELQPEEELEQPVETQEEVAEEPASEEIEIDQAETSSVEEEFAVGTGVEEEPAAEEVEEDPEPAPWYDDSDVERGAGFGLRPEQLAQFGSREELDKYTLLLSQLSNSQQQPAAKDPEPEPEPEKAPQLDIKKFEEGGYGENELELIRAFNAQAEQLAELKQWRQEQLQAKVDQDQQKFIEDFDMAADAYDAGLFGRSRNDQGQYQRFSTEHHGNREKLFNEYVRVEEFMVANAERAGMPAPSMNTIMGEAVKRAFGAELAKREEAARRQKAAEQAKRVRPANSTTASRGSGPAAGDEDDLTSIIANSPEFQAVLNRSAK